MHTESITAVGKRISVAPMMDWTDRHFRYFMRGITVHSWLFTEMVTATAILRGDRAMLLAYDPCEHPLVLQLGGDNPAELARAARIAYEDYGYDEINLNVGCPSDKVQQGNFGACLMARPELVAECVAAMQAVVPIEVSVKPRIGIDDFNEYDFMARFVETVASAGCRRFIVHARIALLQGLSPRANRQIPPLRYADVLQLKRDNPALKIEINGGIRDLNLAADLLQKCDGVMIGRAAYENPYLFATVDSELYGAKAAPPGRAMVLERMIPYLERLVQSGRRPHILTRHMLGLMQGQPGARSYRRSLSDHKFLQANTPEQILRVAMRYAAAAEAAGQVHTGAGIAG